MGIFFPIPALCLGATYSQGLIPKQTGRLVGRYYRPQYRPPSKSPSDYCTYKITRLLDSIELAKNFIEEARTVEKIKIR